MWFCGLSDLACCPAKPLGRREREKARPNKLCLFPSALVRFQQLVHRILFYGNVFVHDRCCHHRGWKWWHLFVCLFQRETKQVVHIPHQQPLRISSSLSTGFNSKGMPSCMGHVRNISWDTNHALFLPLFGLIDDDRKYSFLSHEFESRAESWVWILSLEFGFWVLSLSLEFGFWVLSWVIPLLFESWVWVLRP